jgi:hypothetical protein
LARYETPSAHADPTPPTNTIDCHRLLAQVTALRGQQPTAASRGQRRAAGAQQRRSAGCWVLLAATIAARWRTAGTLTAGGALGGMPLRAHHRGHTAHIHRRLTLMAVYELTGLVVAAVAAALLAVLDPSADGS